VALAVLVREEDRHSRRLLRPGKSLGIEELAEDLDAGGQSRLQLAPDGGVGQHRGRQHTLIGMKDEHPLYIVGA
jgi:hypothetical protein